MKRILLLAGAAAAGVAAYLLLRSPGVTRPIHRTPAAGAPDAGVRPIGRMTPDGGAPFIRRPLGSGGEGGVAGGGGGTAEAPPSIVFEKELRDTGWANEQEKEMTLRLRQIVDALAARDTPIDIDVIECRQTQCRVAIHARDEAALGKLYADLESPAGFYGWADNLLLAPVETAPDGKVTTHVIALFERERE